MSMKVYTGWRVVGARDPFELAAVIQPELQRRVQGQLLALYRAMMRYQQSQQLPRKNPTLQLAVYMLAPALAEKAAKKEHPVDFFDCWGVVQRAYLEQSKSAERNVMHLDVSLLFYKHKGHYYFRTFSDGLFRDVLGCLRNVKGVTPYPYWDNSDRPRNISKREWDRRGRIWDACDDHRAEALVLELVTPGKWGALTLVPHPHWQGPQ